MVVQVPGTRYPLCLAVDLRPEERLPDDVLVLDDAGDGWRAGQRDLRDWRGQGEPWSPELHKLHGEVRSRQAVGGARAPGGADGGRHALCIWETLMTAKLHPIMETLAKQRGYKAGVAAATSLYTMRRYFGYVPPPLPPGALPEKISDKEFEVMKDMKTLWKDATPDTRKVILRKLEREARVKKRHHTQEQAAR